MGWGQTKWRGAPARHSTPFISFVLKAISLQRYIFVSVYHILPLHIFHDVNVVWLCESEHIAAYDTFQDTVADIMLESGTHILKEVSHLFPVVHRDKWVLSSPEMVFGPWRTLSLLIWLIQIWCNKFGEVCFDNNIACNNNCCSKQGIILHKVTKQALRETYSCLHPHFDSFFTSCVHASLTCHQQTSVIPSMLISYYREWVLIALQHVQAIVILQWATTFNHSSSSLPHIPTSAPPSLVDLW